MSVARRPIYRVVTGPAPPYVMYDNSTGTFYGYCIDLLNDIGSLVGFDYTIRESFDTHYGYREPGTGRWNGMVYELMENMSDIAVGPMWITSDRAQMIDFTVSYQKQSGFAIMTLKKKRQIPFLRFLTMLELEVWLGFGFAFFLTVAILFFLERYSPFSYRNNREKYLDEPDDRFSSLKECFWSVFTSLTPEGGGDIPKNLSGKVATATWWLFGFVIVASYTANLAAYETIDRLEKSIESMDDLRKQYRVHYSTVLNSSTYRYFEGMLKAEDKLYRIWRQIALDETIPDWERTKYAIWDYPMEDIFTKMYYTMNEEGFAESLEEAVNMVRKVNRTSEFALIAEAVTIKYLMLTSCDFRQVGEEFGKKPLAFAVQKNSPLKEKIDDAINQLALQRRLNDLERKWWDENPLRAKCPLDRDYNAGFDLDNLGVVFVLILVGIILALLILCLEYLWHWYKLKQRDEQIRLFVRKMSIHPGHESAASKTAAIADKIK